MVVAYVSTTESQSTVTQSPQTVNLSSASTDNIRILMFATVANANVPTTPAGWTVLIPHVSGSIGGQIVWYRVVQAGDPTSLNIAVGAGAQFRSICVTYSGNSITNPIDVASSVWSTGTSLSPPSPTETTGFDNSMVLRLCTGDDEFDQIEANVFPAGVTNRGFNKALDVDAGNGGSISFGEDGLQATKGSTGGATWSFEASEGYATATIAIQDINEDPLIGNKDFTFDSTFATTFPKDVNFDTVLQGVVTKDVTFDTILQFIATGDIQMDAALQKQGLTKDVTFDADLRILVANTLTCQYDMVSFIANTLSNLYDIRNLVSNENTFIYGLGGLVANTLTVLSDIHVLISNTLTSIQSTLDYVSNTLTGRWNITQFISNTLTSIQSTLDYVSNTSTLKYNILNHISNTGTFLYDILPKFTKIQLKNARRKIKLFR